MHATLIFPDKLPQQVTPEQLAALAPRLLNKSETGAYMQPHYTADATTAAALMDVDVALVDVLSTTTEHLVFCVFDPWQARNRAAEHHCLVLGVADYIGDDDGDAGHLFGPFLIIEL